MESYLRGSLIFCDSPDVVGWAIRAGERLRWRPTAMWNHVAIVAEDGTNPHVVQATVDGVTGDKQLSTLQGGPILVVEPPAGLNIDASVKFAEGQIGDPYGYLALVGAVVDQLTPKCLHLDFGREGTWICSALAAESWRAGGWYHNWQSIYQVAPAELALASGAAPEHVYKQ